MNCTSQSFIGGKHYNMRTGLKCLLFVCVPGRFSKSSKKKRHNGSDDMPYIRHFPQASSERKPSSIRISRWKLANVFPFLVAVTLPACTDTVDTNNSQVNK